MEYVLETNALCKQYKGFKALQNLDMRVPKGAIYGFVGKNGAGKTTLIRLVTGLQEPTSGSYTLYGVNNSDRSITGVRKRMGAVVETPSIYGDMTARENLKAQYTTLGMPTMEGIDRLLELVGLSDAGKKKARNFSLGMRQRLGIAVALAGSPDLLILDEPVNGLDPQGIIEIRELILKLNRQMGVTVLISSHILDELARIATHYGFIDGGRMVRQISSEELEAQCRKKTVAAVSDTGKFVRVLDSFHVAYAVLDEGSVEYYEPIPVSRLSDAAKSEGCTIVSLRQQEESLESYFLNLVGGGRNA